MKEPLRSLLSAIISNNKDAILAALANNADVNDRFFMVHLIESGLLENHRSESLYRNLYFLVASENQPAPENVVRFLPFIANLSPLVIAFFYANSDTFKFLLDINADPNPVVFTQNTMLLRAAIFFKRELLPTLIEADVDIRALRDQPENRTVAIDMLIMYMQERALCPSHRKVAQALNPTINNETENLICGLLVKNKNLVIQALKNGAELGVVLRDKYLSFVLSETYTDLAINNTYLVVRFLCSYHEIFAICNNFTVKDLEKGVEKMGVAEKEKLLTTEYRVSNDLGEPKASLKDMLASFYVRPKPNASTACSVEKLIAEKDLVTEAIIDSSKCEELPVQILEGIIQRKTILGEIFKPDENREVVVPSFVASVSSSTCLAKIASELNRRREGEKYKSNKNVRCPTSTKI